MNIKFFSHARTVALCSDFQRNKTGCVVVYRGTIVSSGFNTKKTSPIQAQYNNYRNFNNTPKYCPSCMHAEISALSKIKYKEFDFSKIEIYIYREYVNGYIANSRPCEACMNYIMDLGIRQVFYTTNNGFCHEYVNI